MAKNNYAEYLAEEVNSIMEERGLLAKDIAQISYLGMDFKRPGSAVHFISSIRKGQLGSGNYSQKAIPQRLAIFLEHIGVSENSDLITRTREEFPGFQYPIDRVREYRTFSLENADARVVSQFLEETLDLRKGHIPSRERKIVRDLVERLKSRT